MARHRVRCLLAAALLLVAPMAAAQPWQFCGQSGNFSANSAYQSNLRQLSATLPKNASAALFAAGSLGTVPDIVYALTLCRGDANASACESCVDNAFQGGQQLCPYNKDVFIVYDLCYLRFTNRNLLASATDNGSPMMLMNAQNASATAEVFDAAAATLLNATSSYAAANSSRRFATGEEAFDAADPTIYGLSQCTPDMSPDDCRSCLGDIIALIPQYFGRKRGARVIGTRCNYRYEVYPFFTGGSMLRLPAPAAPAAPPPAPGPANMTPPAPTGERKKNKSGTALAIALPLVVVLLATVAICFSVQRRRRRSRSKQQHSYSMQMGEDIESVDSLFIDLSTLRAATGNFSNTNRLGEGGFGSVYKGVLPNGEEIAVKRLSMSSGQGIEELKNELVLVAKLQHKNLVRLVGVCLQEHEKLLVYEYMPNRSIDTILFDLDKRRELDWGKRFRIINRIARGLQYLHEDSQLRIIHRDLKASNVLLDSDYTPKISDFGLARLFGGDQTREFTRRVVGTYGYMAPEYAMRGHYSVKSDVFSFGILMIEIVTGRRSSGSYSLDQSNDLLSLVWEHWTMGTILEMTDPSLTSHAPRDQMLKCIHIGLLCVQDNPADRPMMSTVNVMLSSSTVSLQSPSKPSFFIPKSDTDSNIYSESHPLTSQSTASTAMATFARHRVLLCRLAAALLLAPLAAAQPWQFCGQGGNYSANGTYQSNLAGLSATLPKNASASRTLFAKDSLGAVPDIVYALALCRGDVANATACESCVATAFQDAQQLCPYDKDAFIVYDLCYLAFSNRNILAAAAAAAADDGSPKFLMNTQNASAPAEVFDAAVATLLNATSSYAAENSSRRFATGEEAFDTAATPTIYGLSQCTPDMSPDDCRSCLGRIIALIPRYLSRRKGGRAIGMRCNFRYEVGPFFAGGSMLRLPAPANSTPTAPTGGRKKNKSGTALAIALPLVVILLATVAICLSVQWWRRRSRSKQQPSNSIQMAEDIENTDSLFIDLSTLRAATGNFSESNRIGEGGFGSVYKGVLPSGEEIAVKRLSMSSGQGIEELKNELVLVAKLQQKNLVRLVGVCLQEHEKLLVYEYMPNRSIDTILFDLEKRKELDWGKRFRIINGIARALQYLHEDSQLRIIHRDLKASNVLLDSDYNPKISDFGLARLFEGDQTREVTSRVVGTYGYMAPEYAMRGHYSVKSDVFSFGILMIEIVTGRRSSGSYSFDQSYDLLSRVWEHWTMGTILEMMDPSLTSHAPRDQMLKCIHIGLLCVQDNPADRPMMSTVNIMLSSNTVSLQSPSKPSFFIPKSGTDSNIYSESYPQTSQPTHRSGMMSAQSCRARFVRQRRERGIVRCILPAAAMLAVVVVVVAVLLPLAAAQQTMQFSSCASGAYAANSTYEANLAVLAAALPGNASTAAAGAAAGYATATVGAVPDQVSALALCRGDANATACRACVAASFRVARRDCPSSKDATTYQDGCIVRFSDQRFLDFVGVNSPVSELYSDADSNITAVPVAWFNAAVVALMNATVDTAVAAGSGSNNTKKYFATAVEDFDPKHYPKIYGMAQCAPVMTAAQCRSCLGGFVSSIPWFLNGKPGGRVLGIWCNLRYSVKPFYQGQPMLQISAPPEPPPPAMPSLAAPPTRTARRRRVAGISAGVACFVVLMLILSAYAFIRFKRKKAAKKDNLLKKMARGKCTIFDLATLKEATENFSEKHKLGEGGFGTVYKGKLPDGQEIAVKKLIESCGHGLNQLHNEVLVLAELQHKNLVRLQGFCVHKDEMLLVYEYIKNGSLDNFLFAHASRGNALSWDQQYNIIFGIAKGIMYLHEDSSIRIIHRDLKANNILLDEDMDPKIADFGLARLIGGGHTHTKTTRIVGTYGYMAPEYAIHGNVSPKIDIFSFGVLVLEIVTKRKNCSYGDGTTDTVNLLSDVWSYWTEGVISQVIDQSLEGHFRNQALRCIHIGLLCVQSDPDDRPDIPSVIFMLTRDNMELQPPTEPAFFFNGNSNSASQTSDQRVYVYDRSDSNAMHAIHS
uniref:Uncharacterized protein n=1 Tax=Oryza meridionalis TaxID=40149 RepID=A0A0E0ECI7_9ORYZ